ncbi:MAG: hypothetical protein ACR2NP_14950 [Pirellulaceae bacterium]
MSATKNHKRKRVSADLRLQGALCLRVAIYWIVCQVVFGIAVLAFFTLQESNPGSTPLTPWSLITPALVISGLVLPLALLDLLVFSNRFAGPALRIRKYLSCLAKGEEATTFKLRKKDFFVDICENLNFVGEQLQAHRKSTAKPTEDSTAQESLPPLVETP